MKIATVLKLATVGAALLLLPRRSSSQADNVPLANPTTNSTTNTRPSAQPKH
ncbi:hypothetical protein [Moraxella atlantae]|uniref:hypothetical protein n=1 Tax=Faucicola atlantae TaxID=34059 RepID=UPI0012E7EF78|nr:hypothetical protein [Moraxella atlantae]